MRKKIVIEREEGEEPNCSNCQDIPLWGCVLCPTPKSRAEKLGDKLQEKLDEIETEVNMDLQTHENTIIKESRRRYETILRIREIIRRGKKND